MRDEDVEFIWKEDVGKPNHRRNGAPFQWYENPNASEMKAVECYLADYRTYSEMIRMNRYERDYFAARQANAPEALEDSELYLRHKLYEIRQFILSLPDSNEKLLLYYRYVHGESVTTCAELLGISRAGAYRMYRRALKGAAICFAERQKIAR